MKWFREPYQILQAFAKLGCGFYSRPYFHGIVMLPMAQNNRKKSNSVTIFDVAKEAGVSYSTVSRVVNNFQFVKEDTREKVLVAMKKLGYVANLQARRLAGGRSEMIGVLIHDLENNYLNEVIKGIDAELSKRDYDLLLSTTHQRLRKESKYVQKLMNGLVDGLIIILPRNFKAYQPELDGLQFPYVVVDPDSADGVFNQVVSENWQGAYKATKHLIDLGHKRIAFVKGRDDVGSAHQRFGAFRQACEEADIAIPESYVVSGQFTKEDGYEAAVKLLALDELPTAVFAANDESALGVITAVLDNGLRVPDDISVVGFDDIPQARQSRPRLTTVRQQMHRMGVIATNILINHIEDEPSEKTHTVLETDLIVRDSTAPPKEV